jgi:hypothetical protein
MYYSSQRFLRVKAKEKGIEPMVSDNPYRSPLESSSIHTENFHSVYTVRQAILNILTIVPITALLITCGCLAIDRTSFLKSDVPYQIGAMIAYLVGFYLTFFHLPHFIKELQNRRVIWYLGTSVIPALGCIGYDWFINISANRGFISILGVSMLLFSLGAIPLGRIRASRTLHIIACFSAVIYGTGYLITHLTM